MAADGRHQCPSVPPEWPGSRAFAVVAGTPEQPRLIYLDQTLPVDRELVRLAEPVSPTEVFRFAGPCARHGCRHFEAATERCRLAQRVIQWLPADEQRPPPCPVRRDCVWWHQEGKAACRRCERVVSHNALPTRAFARAAEPVDGDG